MDRMRILLVLLFSWGFMISAAPTLEQINYDDDLDCTEMPCSVTMKPHELHESISLPDKIDELPASEEPTSPDVMVAPKASPTLQAPDLSEVSVGTDGEIEADVYSIYHPRGIGRHVTSSNHVTSTPGASEGAIKTAVHVAAHRRAAPESEQHGDSAYSEVLASRGIPRDLPAGVGAVHNACSRSIYYSLVHPAAVLNFDPAVNLAPTFAALPPGGTVSHRFSHDPVAGVSWKVKSSLSEPALQFETTWHADSGTVYYDLSYVDGHVFDPITGEQSVVFGNDGVKVETIGESHAAHDTCLPLVCEAGNHHCGQAYHNPHDDWATHRCSDTMSLVAVFCSG